MNLFKLSFALSTLSTLALLGCSGAEPAPPVAPTDSAAPSAAPSSTPQVDAPPAETAAASATAPSAASDPMLAGLTGDDLDWAKKCLDGKGSYCTKFGNGAEFKDKDFAKALAWYKKGCEDKEVDPVDCMGEAHLMIQGQGTTADVDGGLKLWESTCTMDLGRDACSQLAGAYDKGTYGVKKDAKKAKAIASKSCDKGAVSDCKKAGKKPPKP